jgi:hypothetical protein
MSGLFGKAWKSLSPSIMRVGDYRIIYDGDRKDIYQRR